MAPASARPPRGTATAAVAMLGAPLWLGLVVAGEGPLLRGGARSKVLPLAGDFVGVGHGSQAAAAADSYEASAPARSLSMTVRRGDTIIRGMFWITVAFPGDFVRDPNAVFAARDTVAKMAVTGADRLEVVLQLGPASTQQRVEHNGTTILKQAVQVTYNIAVQETAATGMVRTLQVADKAVASALLEKAIENYWADDPAMPEYQVEVTSIVVNGPGSAPSVGSPEESKDGGGGGIMDALLQTDVLVGISCGLAVLVLCCAIAILWPRHKKNQEEGLAPDGKSKYAADQQEESKTDAESDAESDASGDGSDFEPPKQLARRPAADSEGDVPVLSTILEENGESSRISHADGSRITQASQMDADRRSQELVLLSRRASMEAKKRSLELEEKFLLQEGDNKNSTESTDVGSANDAKSPRDPATDSVGTQPGGAIEEPAVLTPTRSRQKATQIARSSSPPSRLASRNSDEKKAKVAKKRTFPEKGQKQTDATPASEEASTEDDASSPTTTPGSSSTLGDAQDEANEAGDTAAERAPMAAPSKKAAAAVKLPEKATVGAAKATDEQVDKY